MAAKCSYCPHDGAYLAWDDDLQTEIEMCACCYGEPHDPKECDSYVPPADHGE